MPRPKAKRCASSAASTCSAPSATSAAASTTSCGAAPAVRATPASRRFYLSLDDELLRLFATGAMTWVMGRTLPEDVPIESKTVAKAIERAQNTVEARNAEMRKDALKYDEVMDQQRKVIYERRLQIIDGDDLEEHTEDLLAGAAEKLVAEHCPTEFEEDWDLKALVDGLTQYYPTKFTVADLAQAATTEDLVESHRRGGARLLREARRGHARRRRDDAPDRARRVPADHGRPLARPPVRDGQPQGRHPPALDRARPTPSTPGSRRATACSASCSRSSTTTTCATSSMSRLCSRPPRPSRTWTRRCTPPPRTPWPRPPPWPGRWQPSAARRWRRRSRCSRRPRRWPLRPPRRRQAMAQADGAAGNGSGRRRRAKAQIKRPNAPDPDAPRPVVKAQHEKVGRNEPCWCGSGKKFKFCHGAA